MSENDMVNVAREIVQQVADAQVGLPDEEDALEIYADQLEEIIIRVLRNMRYKGVRE